MEKNVHMEKLVDPTIRFQITVQPADEINKKELIYRYIQYMNYVFQT